MFSVDRPIHDRHSAAANLTFDVIAIAECVCESAIDQLIGHFVFVLRKQVVI